MKNFDTFLAESSSLALSTVAGHSTGWVAKAVDTLKERGYTVAPSTTAKGTLHATKGQARCEIEVDPISGLVTKVSVGDHAPVMQPFNCDLHADSAKRSFKSEGDKLAYKKGLDDALATIASNGSKGKDAEERKKIEGSTPGQTIKESFEIYGKQAGKLFNKKFETLAELETFEGTLLEGAEVHGRKIPSLNEAKKKSQMPEYGDDSDYGITAKPQRGVSGEADKHLDKAETAKSAGNHNEFHKHMEAHHVSMSNHFMRKYQSSDNYGNDDDHGDAAEAHNASATVHHDAQKKS
jgi:hypothetical protein